MSINAFLSSAARHYSEAKRAIEGVTGAGEDLLHVHAGLLIFVGTALLFRKRMRSWVPLGFVAAFALINEIIDWMNGQPLNVAEPYVDFANTLFWPLILFALARRWR